MSDPSAIQEEERLVRELQRTVDLALFYIRTAPLNRATAEKIIDEVKAKALHLFPDKETTFDLIYMPRFIRVLDQRFGLH